MSGLFNDPNWPRASAWLRGELSTRDAPQLAILDAPLNSSITPGRCDLAPSAIRKALERFSTYDADSGTDLADLAVSDHGDIALSGQSAEADCESIVDSVSKALAESDSVVLLGGDNGITRPGVHGLGVPLDQVGLITLDAHFDLRDLSLGMINGNPIRALLNDGLPGANIYQIGIQPFTNSPAYAQVAKNAGINVVTADRVLTEGTDSIVDQALSDLEGRVEWIYVDLDVDVLDRAFAPACPGSRPGGLPPWMLRRAARAFGANPKVKVMDIVEVDPTQDIADATCLAAASFLLAFASGMLT